VVSNSGFSFESGNLGKLFAIPKYALSWLFSLFVPRRRDRWVFGSGIGVAEGALAVARELRASDADARITWLIADGAAGEHERERAEGFGFRAVTRRGRAGFWATLRARNVVVTHGLGDANRFGVFGARITHLGHGAPLKKLHLDSPITTSVGGPAPVRALLRRMYTAGTRRVALYVAGSVTAAERLRTAYRVDPGRVRVLGDARDDELAEQVRDPAGRARARAAVRGLLGLAPDGAGGAEPLLLYAPTWRDGAQDPAVPTHAEAQAIREVMESLGARLVIRPHPLGASAYDAALGGRVHALGSDVVRDITPHLGAFDAVVTDYSSLAVDFSLLGRPIVWFAPDLEDYGLSRGLYEPLEVTALGQVARSWADALQRLEQLFGAEPRFRASAEADARALAQRFHDQAEGGAAARVLAEIRRLDTPARERIAPEAVFFESFYGRQVSCNPLAIDREIAARHPDVPRYWSVVDERIAVPEGARAVLVGGPDWFAARRHARLLVVNDWLRYGFRRGRRQTVLQTWHGTMLKHLALGRPSTGVRTRLAIRRESRRWSLLLSQNPHSTAQFRSSYAFAGEILETGYPRDDRLAAAVVEAGAGLQPERIPQAIEAARRALGVPRGLRVLAYAPTWREDAAGAGRARGLADGLGIAEVAAELGPDWAVVVRGHTRTHEFGGYAAAGAPAGEGASGGALVIDASRHPDVNDVILAADLLVTDYSSLMFDAAVACVPMAFFVPDLAEYRDRERGFAFDFEADAPGPLLSSREQLVEAAREGVPRTAAYSRWRERFAPHDDGHAAERFVDALEARGALHA